MTARGRRIVPTAVCVLDSPEAVIAVLAAKCRERGGARLIKWRERKASG